MKKIYYYNLDYEKDLFDLLIKHNIKVKLSEFNLPNSKQKWMSFYITFNSKAFIECLNYLPKKPNLIKYEFTKKEMDDSNWFYIRSTCMKLDNYNENTFEYSCFGEKEFYAGEMRSRVYHEFQVEPFAFKPIKWNEKNHFYSSYEGGYNIIFCDDVARKLFEKNNIKGVKFLEVLNAKKNFVLSNSNQIFTDNIIPDDGLVIEGLDEGYVEIKKCPICGKITYIPSNAFRLGIKREYLNSEFDIYRTNYLFGMSRGQPWYIISKKIYKMLVEAKMTRNLLIQPIIIK